MDEGDDEILGDIKRNVKIRMTLLREKTFAELRKFLDETYGAKPDQRHAYECEVLWEEGKQDQALEETVGRLKSSDYNVHHIILCATYAWKLRRKDVADYLGRSFKSKELETSSVVLAEFVTGTSTGWRSATR